MRAPVLVVLMTAVGDDVVANAEVGELVDERREADVAWHVDASRPVVVEDVAEQVRIAVEEVLSGVGVTEVLALGGPEQRVGEPFDGLQPRLVVAPAHVQRQLLARLAARRRVAHRRQRRRHRTTRQRHPADGGGARERQPAGHRRSHVDLATPTLDGLMIHGPRHHGAPRHLANRTQLTERIQESVDCRL